MRTIDGGGTTAPGAGVASQAGNAQPPPMDLPIHLMRVAHGQMHPPDLDGATGVRGRIGAMAKRIVRKLTSWYIEPRWVQQQQWNAQAIEFASLAYNSFYRIDAQLDEMRQQNARLRLQFVALREAVNRYHGEVSDIHGEVTRHEGFLQGVAMHDDVKPLTKEVHGLLDRLGAIGSTGAEIDYSSFEDHFRGDVSEVAKAQERYLSLFPPPEDPGRVIDIGCGRGEMLILLAREGHEITGVDLDEGMVAICREKGLPAVVDDGIHFLSQVEADTLKGIFSAQVVEHLITPEMEQLVRLAYRTLRVGGVLVMETINPRSSFALGNHFYADTSHVRPVHPETLRFICEQVGFSQVQLEERSPHPALTIGEDLPDGPVGDAVSELLKSVFGFQDYVIVATK